MYLSIYLSIYLYIYIYIYIYISVLRGGRNTVGNLVEFRLLNEAYHGPRVTGTCAKHREGAISSNSRCQTALFQQYLFRRPLN